MSYNRVTQQVKVLERGLSGAGGVAVSQDGSYVLVSEFIANRIQKFWLTGPKALTSEVLITFPGRPINIRRTLLGEFWVAVNVQMPVINGSSGSNNVTNVPTGIKINANGNITRTVDLSHGTTNISDFQQRNRQFYM